jgi:hypothetical protein
MAVMTGNRRDQGARHHPASSKDGSVVRNLTPGFDKDRGFEYIAQPSLSNMVPWMSWSPVGDRLAYFVRNEKSKTLIIQNVLTGKIENRFPLQTVDNPESPNISPDGRSVLFSGLRTAIGDIFKLDIASGDITNLTNDDFADYAPIHSPDGSFIVYMARVSGSQKLFRLDADGKKTQLTFGTQDEASAKFLGDDTIIFSSTATDPATPLTPEEARNGNIFNLWSLSLKNGELKQYTDALGGVPVTRSCCRGTPRRRALRSSTTTRAAIRCTASISRNRCIPRCPSDFGSPGPITDFQAPLQHTLVAENKSKKGRFEKMFLDGRPPVNIGVTSSGDVFGGTMVSFTDVLGDQQFSMFASSVQQYKTLSFSYLNLSRGSSGRCRATRRRSSSTGSCRSISTTRPSRRSSAATTRSRHRRCVGDRSSPSIRSAPIGESSSRAAWCTLPRSSPTRPCSSTPRSISRSSSSSSSSITAC